MSEDFFRNEMATLLEYSNLLKKERSEEARAAVNAVINDEKNTVKRINKIKEIDHHFETEGPYLQGKTKTSKAINKLKHREPPVKKMSFLTYFFSIRKLLMSICEESATMVPKMFGMRFQVSDESLSLLETIRNNTLKSILGICQKILENGWQVLEPGVYNVFYTLYTFLNNFSKKFILDKKNITKNFNFVDSVSKEYLMLLADKSYLSSVREGIYLFYANRENEEMSEFLLFIEGIFNKTKKFSFLNFIVSVFSVYYRQPLTLEKIIELKEPERVPESKYLILPKVQYIISEYLAKHRKKLEINEKKMFLLKHIQDEEPQILEDFIITHTGMKFRIEYITTDLLKSSVFFLQALLKYSKSILIDDLNLYKEGDTQKAPLFKLIWEPAVSKIESLLMEIDYQRETYKFLFITLPTYEKFVEQNKHLESEKDEKFCILIDQMADTLNQLFESLSQVLYFDYHLTYNERKEDIIDKLKGRNKPVSDMESERFLPFKDYKVQNYGDDTVLDILTKINTYIGTFLFVLSYPKVKEKLREKAVLMQESKIAIEKIMKLS